MNARATRTHTRGDRTAPTRAARALPSDPRDSITAHAGAPGTAAPASPAAWSLLHRADALFAEAGLVADPVERFGVLYLAALRAAGAALAVSEKGVRRSTSRGAWDRLSRAVPPLAAWAEYFRALSAIRADIEVGLPRYLSGEQVAVVDGAVRDFLLCVEKLLDGDLRLSSRPSASASRGSGGRNVA
ncbi:hypothetical protein GCM10027169_09960 [Gordonia jinhuaensis]|uniref:SAV-6107-like HEPN domain-containing protein n=1 Tax=Gordonia jinhuaensis TaxID=1517702 RepID=A0A916SY14_9ACTN|nr:SAV_6107 family HEPN domain-containing protein [Gordonia jinhuaensis]GGB19185.1 hypothetical protein GCM10011489_04120 [Gordonia jinhuaensis]